MRSRRMFYLDAQFTWLMVPGPLQELCDGDMGLWGVLQRSYKMQRASVTLLFRRPRLSTSSRHGPPFNTFDIYLHLCPHCSRVTLDRANIRRGSQDIQYQQRL